MHLIITPIRKCHFSFLDLIYHDWLAVMVGAGASEDIIQESKCLSILILRHSHCCLGPTF